MKIYFVLFFVVALIGSLFAQDQAYSGLDSFSQAEGCDFRLSHWGDSGEDVIAAEVAIFSDMDDSALYYVGFAFNMTMILFYQFDEDKLFEGMFILAEDYTEPQQYIDAFNEIENTLTLQYGESAVSTILSSNEEHKAKSHWVEGLTTGDLTVTSYWKVGETLVTISMGRDEEGTFLTVDYYHES